MAANIEVVIAIAGIGVTMVGVMMGMMFWVRQESNSLRQEAKEDRKDLIQIIRSMEAKTEAHLLAIHAEIKDFHGRLCAIEERNKRG